MPAYTTIVSGRTRADHQRETRQYLIEASSIEGAEEEAFMRAYRSGLEHLSIRVRLEPSLRVKALFESFWGVQVNVAPEGAEPEWRWIRPVTNEAPPFAWVALRDAEWWCRQFRKSGVADAGRYRVYPFDQRTPHTLMSRGVVKAALTAE